MTSLRIIVSSRFIPWCGRRRSIRHHDPSRNSRGRHARAVSVSDCDMAIAGFRPRAIRATIAVKTKRKLIGGNPMINRRTFAALLAGTVATPKRAWSEPVTAKTVFYTSVGPELTLFDIDVADAALQKRSSVTLPANIQYAWPHPSKRYLYVVSSNGGPGVAGDKHLASAFRIPHPAFYSRTASRRRCRRDPSTPVSTNQATISSPPTMTRATRPCI